MTYMPEDIHTVVVKQPEVPSIVANWVSDSESSTPSSDAFMADPQLRNQKLPMHFC